MTDARQHIIGTSDIIHCVLENEKEGMLTKKGEEMLKERNIRKGKKNKKRASTLRVRHESFYAKLVLCNM